MKTADNKLYILTRDYKIGVIRNICNCEKCVDRGEIEVFIDNLDGSYLDCIRISEFCSGVMGNDILTCGYSVQEIFDYMKTQLDNCNKKCDFLSEVNILMNKLVCEKEKNNEHK